MCKQQFKNASSAQFTPIPPEITTATQALNSFVYFSKCRLLFWALMNINWTALATGINILIWISSGKSLFIAYTNKQNEKKIETIKINLLK